MYEVLLTVTPVLACMSSGTCWTDTPETIIGLDREAVGKVLLRPYSEISWPTGSNCSYSQTDWLGGKRDWLVQYRDGFVVDSDVVYFPFRARPPWLQSIQRILTPSGISPPVPPGGTRPGVNP